MNAEPTRNMLIVEDNPGDVRLLKETLRDKKLRHIQLKHVESMADAELYLRSEAIDIILLDLGLPDAQGLESVRRARAASPRSTLVVLSGMDDESMAIQALQEGAQDYLIKGQIASPELVRALRYSLERKKIEDVLFAEKERAQVTLACIADAVISTDISGRINYLNLVAENMTGWSLEEVKGGLMKDTFRILDEGSRLSVLDPMHRQESQNDALGIPHETILIQKNGAEVFVEHSTSPIHDREANVIGVVFSLRDVSSSRAMTRQITHSGLHDHLTDLPNRLLLNDRIDRAIASGRRYEHRVALLFLDLDGFKHINDSLGHPMGDKLVQSVAQRLSAHIRGPDTVSRQGGDEFIILLANVEDEVDTAAAASRLLRALEIPHHIKSHELYVTASIGISMYPEDGLDAETLIRNADTAMYQAKENDRQSYQFFRPDMNVRAMERQFLEENLRHALGRGELALHYQPKVSLTTGKITGAEALLRWTHPTRGSISPAEFIPVAEESGLILPIGLWALRTACRQAQEWADAGVSSMSIAVNVSAVQLRHREFVSSLFDILKETHLDPQLLQVEVTESLLMKRPDVTLEILQQLREKGISIAIDDFGTGYSNLSYLHRFPLDALKIDQSFIRQITSGEGASIVNAIMHMGRNLGLLIIAEGVETEEELSFLKAHLCEEAQGYYFSRPVPAHVLSELLSVSGQTLSPDQA